MAETTSKLQEQLKALTHGKVDILLDADTFKNTTQILREMSTVWEEMTDMEQAAALELLGGKRQANILSSLISNFETVEEVIETSMNSSGSAMAENAKWMDSIEGKSQQLTNAMQALWNNTLNSDVIKFFLDVALGATELVDAVGLLPSALAGALFYFTAIKKNNPTTLFKDIALHAQNYQQTLAKIQTLKSLNLNIGEPGNFNASAVNAYAAAVSGLTTQKQAEMLATQGLNKAQIAEVLSRNGVEKAVINETVSKMNLKNTTQSLTAATIAEVISTDMAADKTQEKAIADFLAANGSKKLTLELVQQAVAQGVLTAEQAAGIIANYNLAFSWKALGASIKAAFMSNPIGWITMIVSGITMLVSKVKQAKKEVVEAAQQTVSAYQESQKTLRDQKKTIDELSTSYEKLSKGVDLDTNNNISLTTDSYQEYLNICNDIADMYPHLVTGFDAQGNAILSLKGNVDQLVQAYKDAAQAARQEMIAGGGDIFDTFKNAYDVDPTTTFEDTGLTQQIKLAKKLQELVNEASDDEIIDFFDKIQNSGQGIEIDGGKYTNIELMDTLEAMGVGVSWNNMAEWQDAWTGKTDVEKFKQTAAKINAFVKSNTNKINTETSKVKSLMDAYLGEDLDYAALSDKSRATISQIVSSLDAEFINGFDSADALYNHIKTNIVDVFKDTSVIDAIGELSKLQLEFAEGDISYSDYISQLEEHISKIQNKFDKETLAQIKIGIGIDEASLQTSINHINALLHGSDFVGPISNTDEIYQKISSLSVDDLQIAGQLEVPEGTILSWDELVAKIKEAKIAATKDFDITNYTDAIANHSAVISEYQEALQKLGKGSFTMDDFMGLIKKYPELAKGVDISSNAFHGLSRNLSGAIRSSTKNFVKDLQKLRVELVAAGKSTDSIDQLIEAIENMPSDALDDTIQKYSTLADKINEAKTAQDKLLASMEENPNEGYETRGEAMDYMKEAMEKGEIGSESNLWNVAEKYGFTYDSAKTINENADALAKYIAIREKWFKEEEDKDGNAIEGSFYKGTESFIKDVESAVKKNKELQKILTWDYNENTGTLDFDYNNEDWDTIVSILSKTKELAGLTSDEFADMMIQIGQYFGIEWGNYDDVLGHLNGIATGASDAKTKVEEYGKAMQDYFGKDTTIDLTTRPMVKFDSTNFKEWEKLYQEIVNNPNGHSEADVKNAKEQLASIQKGDSHATVYSSTFSNKDGTKSVVVTPILPNGEVLSPAELETYANKLLAGEEIDPNINIKLAEFNGAKSIQQADEYAQALHEAQAEYDLLRDTLSVNATIDEKGIEGLKEIKEIQNSIVTKADGTIVIDEDAFKEALEGAHYTEDQIDAIIEKIKQLNSEAFNVDPLKVSDTLETKGVAGLKEINKLQGAIKEDSDTGLTILDTDMFTSVLTEAGYTKTQIDELIKKIQEYQGIVSVSGNTDPLGLNNASLSIDALKASLRTLDVTFTDTLGKWFDGKRDLNINVQDMVSALKAKGWTDEAIKNYMTQLSNTNLEGFNINVKTDQIDEALKKANEVPDEKKTDYEVIGTGVKKLDDIDTYWANITKDKTTNYTINETTVKKTKTEGGGLLGWLGFGDADGTAHVEGTAFSSGSWGAPRTETALTGELGPEILVRGNRWTTVGENGAEFTDIKKGDIIFNHQQSASLLKNGYITSRGKAYAGGTAYAQTNSTFAKYDFSGTGGYIKYDVNDKAVESWGDISGATKKAKDAADEFADTIDWVEIRLEEINEQLDLMNAKLENAGTYAEQNSIIDQMIGVNENKMNNLTAGIKKYSDYAARLLADVPAQYREAAQNGAISISEFAGEADEKTVEAINNYREWAQKVADLNQQLEETKTEIRDLAIQKFDNVQEFGDAKAAVEDSQTEKLQNAVDFDETRGMIADATHYAAMMENSYKKIEYLTSARNDMQKELDDAVKSGRVKRYTTEWYDLVNQMYEVDNAIGEATIELEEFQNAINDIYWESFDELIDQYDYISDETQGLIDLMSSEDLYTKPDFEEGWGPEDVKWTKEGIATLGLHAQEMERAEAKAKDYARAIDDLTAEYHAGHYSQSEYNEKLNELTQGQYEAIEAAKEEKEAIVELQEARIEEVKRGIERQIDAYEELIEKKKEELDAEKDLYDFQKNIMEQQKDIQDIQRRLSALSGDNSASAVAKRKQLESELAEANANLQDTYYDRSVSDRQEALDRELESFKESKDAEMEALDKYLEDVEQVVTDSLNIVQQNATQIGQTLTDKTEEYNLTVSSAVLDPWRDGALAIDEYTTKFGDSISSTTTQLEGMRSKWHEIAEEMRLANIEADKYYKAGTSDGKSVSDIYAENERYIEARKDEPKKPATNSSSNSSKPANNSSASKAPPKTGSSVKVKKSATHFGSKSGSKKMASFVPGGSYTVYQTSGSGNNMQLLIGRNGSYTGWVNLKDIQGYSRGAKSVNKDQLALIDELGEELQIVPGKNGRLEYIKKGTGIVPADLTERLMDLAMNPQEVLDRNRPQIGPTHITNNNEINIDMHIAEVVHIDEVTNDTIPDLTKAINKQMESYMGKLNNSLKKYVR